MARIRAAAAFLSILTMAIGAWALVAGASWPVVLALAVSAALLALMCPFDAPDPGRRTIVALACLAHGSAVGAATVLTQLDGAAGSLVIAQVVLAEVGLALAGWALATRNRRRLPGSSRYFEN